MFLLKSKREEKNMVHKMKRISSKGQVTIEIDIPKDIENYKQLDEFLWKKFHLSVDTNGDYEGSIFSGDDLRSWVGDVDEFGGGSATLVLRPRYYAQSFSNEWRKLKKSGRIIGV